MHATVCDNRQKRSEHILPWRLMRKWIWGLCLIIFLLCFFHCCEEQISIPFHKDLSDVLQKLEPMHIFLSVIGEKNVPRLLNTLKSLLYYQNRVRHDREGCLISIRNATVLPCSRNRTTVSRRTIHLHLLADEETRGSLYSNLSQWKLQNFTWTIYPTEEHLDKVKWIPNNHSDGNSALLRLTLTTILPEFVHKVITLDVGMLLNDDIEELWNHFYHFRSEQILAYAWDQKSNSSVRVKRDAPVIPAYRCNGGPGLQHLQRMRLINWEALWHGTLETILEKQNHLTEGEQEVMRTIILQNSDLYYKLPCEWNVQTYSGTASECCQVIWPLHYPDQVDCWTKHAHNIPFQPVKLVHSDLHLNPSEANWTSNSSESYNGFEQKLTTSELRNRYVQTYNKLLDIELACFT
ncbi:hypothetical protein D915_005068 [Fasciola hepatica]|uniref:Uncharacterized protein n=1 Tax=Fasciola hepatica TaxID=6192 RepID=A0A4E0RAC4_FASHE|nr:hypothetical protein D915_005068 [Fasciola hepatica]